MKPRITLAAAALTAAGAIAAVTVSLGPAAASTSTTISLTSVEKAQTRVPNGVVIADVDSIGGKTVGADTLNCRGTGPNSADCAVSINLATGNLFLVVKPTKTGAAGRVIAGTGAYADRTGTVLAKDLNRAGSRTDVTITFGG